MFCQALCSERHAGKRRLLPPVHTLCHSGCLGPSRKRDKPQHQLIKLESTALSLRCRSDDRAADKAPGAADDAKDVQVPCQWRPRRLPSEPQTNWSDGDCKEQLVRHWCLVHRHQADLSKRGRSRLNLSDSFWWCPFSIASVRCVGAQPLSTRFKTPLASSRFGPTRNRPRASTHLLRGCVLADWLENPNGVALLPLEEGIGRLSGGLGSKRQTRKQTALGKECAGDPDIRLGSNFRRWRRPCLTSYRAPGAEYMLARE